MHAFLFANGRQHALKAWMAVWMAQELIKQVNPVVRGWGHHYKRAHVRKLFHRLDGWLVRRIWSHRFGKWRCCGWTTLPVRKLYGEFGLVNLVALIPSIATQRMASS